MARQRKSPRKSPQTLRSTVNVARIPIRLRGWWLRTLRMDTTGEYRKLKALLEMFLLQAERRLSTRLWDRGTEVALEEALQHLGLRWGPGFRAPLEVEARVTDTHLKFSLTMPRPARRRAKRTPSRKGRQRREAAAERSLYVVKRLADRLHVGLAGRQLAFWRLLPRSPSL
ncbi:MAG: hypothetical protein ACE5HL_06975 [Terriglobia bacterium]